jgi:arylsulfatase A-like enzyme
MLFGCAEKSQDEIKAGRANRQSTEADIILITVDTLRLANMSIYGYERETTPNLDKFFESQAVYHRAYSTESDTPASIVSILSGLLPQQHGVRLFFQALDDDTRILPEYLKPNYQTAGFISSTVLTDEAMEIGSRFDHFDDFVADRESGQANRVVFERTARDTTEAVLEWLREKRDPDRPLFLWVHYIDPHGPYAPPDYWQRKFEHDKPLPIGAGARILDYMYISDDALDYIDGYDDEIAYTDHEIGRLIEGYDATYSINDALVIFTSDHGETMMEHRYWFGHGYHVYEDLIRVPLMLRGPGVIPGNFYQPVSTTDIASTILTYAQHSIPDTLTQVDLLSPPAEGKEHRIITAESITAEGQWRTALQDDIKYMVLVESDGDAVTLTRKRLYNLATDPNENKPKSWPRKATSATNELAALIAMDPDPAGQPAEFRQGTQLTAPKIRPGVSERNLDALRSLGYVE